MDDPAAPSAVRSAIRREAPHPLVSRVVAGEFTEDAAYSTWRERGTSDWLLIYTVAGSGRVVGSAGEVVTAPGDAVLLRPRIRHDYGTHGDSWALAFAHFHPRAEWTTLLDWPHLGGDIGALQTPPGLRGRVLAALRASVRAATSPFAQSELFAVNAIEAALLWLDTQNPSRRRMDDRLLRVVEHIGSDLTNDLDVASLARIAHVSPSRLTHLFTAALGISPQRYVERERLARAAQLLDSTSRAVGDVARDVGWDDPLYFSRRFRHAYGVSPRAHRERSRATADQRDGSRTTS